MLLSLLRVSSTTRSSQGGRRSKAPLPTRTAPAPGRRRAGPASELVNGAGRAGDKGAERSGVLWGSGVGSSAGLVALAFDRLFDSAFALVPAT